MDEWNRGVAMIKYIVAIDQSTSGTKVLLVDAKAKIIYKKAKAHQQLYPQPGWVEHDPVEIYENVKHLLNDVLTKQAVLQQQIKGLSITNQRETIVVWDKETGVPVHHGIVWQCRRTADACVQLKEQGYEQKFYDKTGLTLDPYFSATKVKWILEHVPDARKKAEAGKLLLGTIDSWLIWKLTDGEEHVTDYTNASRTALFNIHTLEWDQELLEILNIPHSMLPVVKSSDAIFGVVSDEEVSAKGMPISGVIGDSQGALFGQKCFEPGMAKATYGTGTSVLMHTKSCVNAENGLVTSIAWGIGDEIDYALEGIIRSTGDTINWLSDQLALIKDVSELEPLAKSIDDNQGVYLIPAFVGLGAPYWDAHARAAIVGLNRNSGKAHVARAALESIAYQVKDAVELIEKASGIKMQQLRVDGGATANGFLMQFQADMLGTAIRVSSLAELSAMGSVYLAGLGLGVWQSVEEISTLNPENEGHFPSLDSNLKDEWYRGWKRAVNRIL